MCLSYIFSCFVYFINRIFICFLTWNKISIKRDFIYLQSQTKFSLSLYPPPPPKKTKQQNNKHLIQTHETKQIWKWAKMVLLPVWRKWCCCQCNTPTSVQSSPVQSSPVQSSPVQSSPVQSSPVQSSPVQSSPGGTPKVV